jgi:protein-disulfide isomerase-like protein with CxxC motif
MRRNEKDMPLEKGEVAGIMIKRNPGVALLWTTRSYKIMKTPTGPLFRIGDPEQIEFYAEGRQATREEIMTSIESGMPILRDMAKEDGPEAEKQLQQQYHDAMELVPA